MKVFRHGTIRLFVGVVQSTKCFRVVVRNRLRPVSLFSWSVEQNARDRQITKRVTEGARRERHALVSRVSRLRRSTHARACTPLTKSEEKEGLLAVRNIVSIIVLLDCPATCTCFSINRKAIWVTKTPFQKLSHDFGPRKEKCGRTPKQGPTTLLPGGWGTPLYKLYRYVPPNRVGFLRRFGLNIHLHTLCPFWSGIGYGFRWNYGSIWTYLSWKMSKKERRNMRTRKGFEEFFIYALLSNDNIISA